MRGKFTFSPSWSERASLVALAMRTIINEPRLVNFQQCGILTCLDYDKAQPVQPPFSSETPIGVQSVAEQS